MTRDEFMAVLEGWRTSAEEYGAKFASLRDWAHVVLRDLDATKTVDDEGVKSIAVRMPSGEIQAVTAQQDRKALGCWDDLVHRRVMELASVDDAEATARAAVRGRIETEVSAHFRKTFARDLEETAKGGRGGHTEEWLAEQVKGRVDSMEPEETRKALHAAYGVAAEADVETMLKGI